MNEQEQQLRQFQIVGRILHVLQQLESLSLDHLVSTLAEISLLREQLKRKGHNLQELLKTFEDYIIGKKELSAAINEHSFFAECLWKEWNVWTKQQPNHPLLKQHYEILVQSMSFVLQEAINTLPNAEAHIHRLAFNKLLAFVFLFANSYEYRMLAKKTYEKNIEVPEVLMDMTLTRLRLEGARLLLRKDNSMMDAVTMNLVKEAMGSFMKPPAVILLNMYFTDHDWFGQKCPGYMLSL